MFAIFKTGGKQYCVEPGQILKVEKIEGKKGDILSFNDILAVSDNSEKTIGNPIIKGAKIAAKILDQIRDKKIIVFKKRKRQNYRSTQGHRQYLTVLKIESITNGSKKVSSPKLEEKTKMKESQIKNKKTLSNKEKTENKTKRITKKKVVKKKQVKNKTIKKTPKGKK